MLRATHTSNSLFMVALQGQSRWPCVPDRQFELATLTGTCRITISIFYPPDTGISDRTLNHIPWCRTRFNLAPGTENYILQQKLQRNLSSLHKTLKLYQTWCGDRAVGWKSAILKSDTVRNWRGRFWRYGYKTDPAIKPFRTVPEVNLIIFTISSNPLKTLKTPAYPAV